MSTCRAKHSAYPESTVPCTCPQRPQDYLMPQPLPASATLRNLLLALCHAPEWKAEAEVGLKALDVLTGGGT